MKKLLKYLETHGKATCREIAQALSCDEEEIRKKISDLEEKGIIAGYRTVIDWDKFNDDSVSAIIEVKVTPQLGKGFDRIAEKINQYEPVKSLYLMSSGDYDLSMVVEGRTLKEVAMFVAQKLAPMECVTSTATYFILKRYKEGGMILGNEEEDIRQVIEF